MLPDFYLARPPMPDAVVLDEFDQLWERLSRGGRRQRIDCRLDAPKWQFLCWLADTHDVVLHGSGRDDIESFEPRLPADKSEFASREAVFAASDGIWAMLFAILNRAAAYSLVNACFTVDSGLDGIGQTVHYYFSVNAGALDGDGFGSGVVYVLPRTTFERQPDDDHDGAVIVSRQWASLVPVRPLAQLAVAPGDFPFLADVRGHDVEALMARAEADPDAFPWRV